MFSALKCSCKITYLSFVNDKNISLYVPALDNGISFKEVHFAKMLRDDSDEGPLYLPEQRHFSQSSLIHEH